MKKIERPDWRQMAQLLFNHGTVTGDSTANLNKWFTENLEGKCIVDESDLEEVWDLGNGEWFAPSNTEKISSRYENKAYLIKSSIQPIKKETCRDFIEAALYEISQPKFNTLNRNTVRRFLEKAKAAVDRESE